MVSNIKNLYSVFFFFVIKTSAQNMKSKKLRSGNVTIFLIIERSFHMSCFIRTVLSTSAHPTFRIIIPPTIQQTPKRIKHLKFFCLSTAKITTLLYVSYAFKSLIIPKRKIIKTKKQNRGRKCAENSSQRAKTQNVLTLCFLFENSTVQYSITVFVLCFAPK